MTPLRPALDTIYRLSGGVAAAFVFLIFATVFGQVLLNVIDAAVALAGAAPMGLLIPSYADFAGFFLAAATFFALAHTFHQGGHIRVSLFLVRLPSGPRRAVELFCHALAATISGFLAWNAAFLAYASWTYGDASYGLVAIPIWVPQLSFVLGAATLTLCLIDGFVSTLGGRPFGQAPPLQSSKADKPGRGATP